MVRRVGAAVVVVLAAGAVWWLLVEDSEPTYVPPEEVMGEESEGEVGLAGTARPSGSEEDGAGAYAAVSDPGALLPFLVNYRTSEEAGRRLRELLGDDAERIRAFLRLLHPDRGASPAARPWVRSKVTEVLVASGDVALDVLLAELDDKNATYRTFLDAFIGGFRRAAERAVPRLLRQLRSVPEDPPAGEAASVINALGAIGPAAAAVLPDLYRWLEDGVTQDVEIAAAGAMVRIGGATEATWDCCRDLLREVNWPRQQQAALHALGELGLDAAPIIAVLLECVQERLLNEGSVLHAIKQIGVTDKYVIDYLTRRFREAEQDGLAVALHGQTLVWLGERYVDLAFRLAAERGVGARVHLLSLFRGRARKDVPWERVLREMEPAFAAKDPAVRQAAYEQLWNAETLPQARRERYALRGLEDADADVRLYCAFAAGELQALSGPLAAALMKCLVSKEENLDTASGCLGVLAEHSAGNNDALFRAAVALRERHPESWASLYRMHHFTAAHPKEVMALWAEGVAQGHAVWYRSIHVLRKVPAPVLSGYPDAEKALSAFNAARRRAAQAQAQAPGMLPR